MKRCQLKRKTPLKRTSRIKPVSDKRRAQNTEYAKVKAKYLAEHQICEMCLERKATQIHHAKGRTNQLLCDSRFFMALCHEDHQWIHDHPATARDRGVLASASEFGVSPK